MKKKLNLGELEIKSFVTNLDEENEKTIVGGSHVTGCGLCETEDDHCPTTPHNCGYSNFKFCASNYRKCSYAICPVPYEPAKD